MKRALHANMRGLLAGASTPMGCKANTGETLVKTTKVLPRVFVKIV